jgi:nitrate reductase assembly molybdenum cofactor insertion protein NarJ
MKEMSDRMNDIVGLLESELEAAFEVKDKQSLHRYVVLMVDRFAARAGEEERHSRLERKMDEGFAEIKEDVRSIAAAMREGFARFEERFEAIDQRFVTVDKRFEEQNEKFEARFAAIDKRFEAIDRRFEEQKEMFEARFEAVDKRFDDMNKRFNSLVVLMSVFFTVLAGMMTALRVFG